MWHHIDVDKSVTVLAHPVYYGSAWHNLFSLYWSVCAMLFREKTWSGKQQAGQC